MGTTMDNARDLGGEDTAIQSAKAKYRAQLSVADGLYLLVLLAAAVMRFSELGLLPLSPIESEAALSAWQFLQPGPNEIIIGSPAYATLTSLLMLFFGVSDVTARMVPALFGFGIVLLPWLLRSRLGEIGMLATASLFAASPLLAATSRSASGDSIALFAIVLVFVSALRLLDEADKNWLYILSGAIGLGLASSPLFYSGLITLAFARLAQRVVSPEVNRRYQIKSPMIVKAIAIGVLSLLALSTRFFTHLSGLGSAAQIFGDWLNQFSAQGDLQTFLAPFLVLGRYEIILLPLGAVALIWAIWRNHPFGTLCTYWLLTGLFLMLLQRGILNNAYLPTIAGYMLLGVTSNYLLRRDTSYWTWAMTGVIILTGAIVLVNVARFLRVSLIDQQVANLWISLMALAAAVLFIYYFWAEQQKSILQGLWLGILTLSLLYQWGTAWNLTHATANDPREGWVVEATDTDVLWLTNTLKDISRRANNSDYDIPLFSAVDTPVLRWYLRDFREVAFGQTLPLGARYAIIITSAENSEPALGDDYLGGDFGLLRGKTAEEYLSATPLLDALRWVLFHESTRETREERIILWVRADVASPR